MKIYTAIFRHSADTETIVAANHKEARETAKDLADTCGDKLACVIDRTDNANMVWDLYDQMLVIINTLPPTNAARALKLLADEWFVKATKA